jgi:outer membrane lipoprotein carrier protein
MARVRLSRRHHHRLNLPDLIRAWLSIAVVSFIATAWSGSLLAADMSTEQVRAVVAGFLDKTQSFSAKFNQEVFDTKGELVDAGSGQLWLQRPGRLRWSYEQPWERDIVATEERIWMYDAELEQVIIRNAGDALTATPAALLVGGIAALDQYDLSGIEASGRSDVRLKPKILRGDFTEIGLAIEADELLQLLLFDRFGQRTVIDFSSSAINEPVDPLIFEFQPPASADIIDESDI